MGAKIGHTVSEETRKKISENHKSKGIKPPPYDRSKRRASEETKLKMSEAHKKLWASGKRIRTWKLSDEARENIRIGHVGINTWMSGRKLSADTRKKISIANSGSKSSFWRGGVTKENVLIRSSAKYKQWRLSVFERDNFTCVTCGANGYIEADHIKPFAYFPELRFDINNGRTLCKPCHKNTDTYLHKAVKKYAIRSTVCEARGT